MEGDGRGWREEWMMVWLAVRFEILFKYKEDVIASEYSNGMRVIETHVSGKKKVV